MKVLGIERPLRILVAGLIAIGFGLLTIKSGAGVLFGSEEAQHAAGSFLPWLVWFNLLAGFAYIAAGAALWFQRRWGVLLALGIAIATVAAFGVFGAHVLADEAYEMRTVWAMLLRTTLWAAIAFVACRAIGCLGLRQAR